MVEAAWGRRTRGLLLGSPSNPTGTVIEEKELGKIARFIARRGGVLIVDEIYQGLVYGEPPVSALGLPGEVAIVNSFSKYFCMTGWRLGWVVLPRRRVRELEKLKAGDEVELRVYRDGSTRTVRVKTVAADELNREVFGTVTSAARLRVGNRAVLGISLGGNGSMRDTLGVLVVGVANEGPAAKAGIDEGDRLAAINGVDLRVAREDAGDWQASSARIRRLNREMEKVNAGDAVELRVYSNGQVKTVRVEAAKASDVKGDGLFFGGTGELMEKIRVMPSGSGRSTFSYSPGVAISIPAVTAPKLEVERRLRATDAALAKVRVQSQAKLRQKLEATTGMTRKARRTILL